MKRREQIAEEARKERDVKIIADYSRRDDNGNFIMTVKEVAEKYGVSVPLVYKILEKADK